MHIQKIRMENYGPFYGAHEFGFQDRGLTLIMGNNQDEPRMNSNGAGKSSILDALDFALFGKIPRNDHVDSIVNEESKNCSVVVYLLDDSGRQIEVIRERTKATVLRVLVDGEVIEALDIKETLKILEGILGVDREVFHAAVLFAQTDLTHYADSSDSERMNILTKILQLGDIDDFLGVAKDTERKARKAREGIVAKIEAKRELLSSYDAKKFEAEITSWENARQERLKELIRLIEHNVVLVNQHKEQLQQFDPMAEADCEILKQQSSQLPLPDDTEVKRAETQVMMVELKLQKLMDDYKEKSEELVLWQRKGEGVCTECQQIVTAEHLQREIEKRNNQLVNIQQRMSDSTQEATAARSVLGGQQVIFDQMRNDYRAAVQQYQEKINEKQRMIMVARGHAQQIDNANLEMRRLDSVYAETEKEKNPWEAQRDETLRAYEGVRAEIEQLEAQFDAVGDHTDYIEFWIKAFGPKGLKSYILDARLQELTDAVNQWVTILTGGTIWVQFATQKKTRSSKVINSPAIRVCRWNPDGTITERNFNSWSGGEKQRISFAIDFGLSRLIAKRARQTYNLLILDEVFRHLDQGGKEAVMEMLQALAREKSSVFVVEHDTDFQAAFENRVLVRKKNRRSTIEELTNEQEKSNESAQAIRTPGKVLSAKPVVRKQIKRTPIRD